MTYRESVAEHRRVYVLTMLEKHQGNVTAAAREAAVQRTSFHDMMRQACVVNPFDRSKYKSRE